MKKLISLAFVLYVFTLAGCGNIIDPVEEPIEGRRDYEWQTMYLSIPISKIGGVSPKFLFGSDEVYIYRFDGSSWNIDHRAPSQVNEIYGVEKRNIFAAGWGFISHFNGLEWKDYEFSGEEYYDIASDDRGNIYVIGVKHGGKDEVVLRQWLNMEFKSIQIEASQYRFHKMVYDNNAGIFYLAGIDVNDNTHHERIFEFDGKNINEIYYVGDSGENISMVKAGNEVLFVIGSEIKYYFDGRFIGLTQEALNAPKPEGEFAPINYAYDSETPFVFGRSRNDLFIGSSSNLFHYNGRDSRRVEISSYFGYVTGVCFEKSAYVLARAYGGNTTFYIGELDKNK